MKEVQAILKEDSSTIAQSLPASGAAQDATIVTHILHASLQRVTRPDARLLFAALAVCPEDVPVPLDAIKLVWRAYPASDGGGMTLPALTKIEQMQLRQAVAELVDQNLLLWDSEGGVKMHDVVRDFSRSRQGPASLRLHQRALVQLLLSSDVSPAGRWQAINPGPLSLYVARSLEIHVSEAVLENPVEDKLATSWLDYTPANELASDFVARIVISAMGADALAALSDEAKVQRDLWRASRLMFAASVAMLSHGSKAKTAMAISTVTLLQQFNASRKFREQTVRLSGKQRPSEPLIDRNDAHPDLFMVAVCARACARTRARAAAFPLGSR